MVFAIESPSVSRTNNDSGSAPSASSFVQFLVVFIVFGFTLLSLPRVSSFSPSPSRSGLREGSSLTNKWWIPKSLAPNEPSTTSQLAGATMVSDSVSTESRSQMESMAGGYSSKRRRRKERVQNRIQNDNNSNNNQSSNSPTEVSRMESLPDPLVPFESVESLRLMETAPGEDRTENSLARVAVGLCSDTSSNNANDTIEIDPRDLHQTSDFDLWMAFRKHLVDVSASQMSVVLDTNYFTSRERLLQDKIRDRIHGGSRNGGTIRLSSDEDRAKHPKQSNSKACAWGIKMEPLAFAQYSDLIEATNTVDNDEGTTSGARNFVEETGMYLLRHVDPDTQKTYVFGASPDGMVTEHRLGAGGDDENDGDDSATKLRPSIGLLEIKSLWAMRNIGSLREYTHCPSRFYDQIQGQLAICDKEWCDLMLFIPPSGGGTKSGNKKKRKGKSSKRHKKQQAASIDGKPVQRKAKGKNYSIVRVKRNETYWQEKLLPALIEFCDEVEAGIAKASAKEDQ